MKIAICERRCDTVVTEGSCDFRNASCVTALVDRLTHHADIRLIEGHSYRRRQAEARRPPIFLSHGTTMLESFRKSVWATAATAFGKVQPIGWTFAVS